jgi:hypothetical protein
MTHVTFLQDYRKNHNMYNLWTDSYGLKQSVAPFALRIGNEVKSCNTPFPA